MESIDSKIKAILNGQIAEDDEKEFLNVDFTLEQHNADLSKFRIIISYDFKNLFEIFFSCQRTAH